MLHVIRYLNEKVTKPIIIIFSLISNKYTINIFINKAFLGIKMKFILFLHLTALSHMAIIKSNSRNTVAYHSLS